MSRHGRAPWATLPLLALGLALFLPACAEPGSKADAEADRDAHLFEEVDAPTTALIAPPNNNKEDCRAAGWTWVVDVSYPPPFDDYAPDTSEYGGPDAGGPPDEPQSEDCYCVLRCESDADCVGTTRPFCHPIRTYDGSDAASCPADWEDSFTFCVSERPRPGSRCVNPPSGSWCR